MTRQMKGHGGSSPDPEPPFSINLKITMPRKTIWVASGFLSGTVTSEVVTHLIRIIHGG